VKNISSCAPQKSTVIVNFVVYGSAFTTHRSQQKGEASRKSRADLEGNSF